MMRGEPPVSRNLAVVGVGFAVFLHEFRDHLVLVDEFLTELLDLLLFELGDLGLSHFRRFLRLGGFLESSLGLINHQSDPLMDLGGLDR